MTPRLQGASWPLGFAAGTPQLLEASDNLSGGRPLQLVNRRRRRARGPVHSVAGDADRRVLQVRRALRAEIWIAIVGSFPAR
jgi:hypothetical protein